MTTTYLSTRNDIHLARAIEIIEAFLNTNTEDDYVNIFLFDHVTVEALSNNVGSTTLLQSQTLSFAFCWLSNKGKEEYILSIQATYRIKNVIFFFLAKFSYSGTFGDLQIEVACVNRKFKTSIWNQTYASLRLELKDFSFRVWVLVA